MQTCSIGLVNPKSAQNIGAILRAAGCFGAHSVIYTGQRIQYAMSMRTDTHNMRQKIPHFGCSDLFELAPRGASKVAVELVKGATNLTQFKHPDNAYYIFGPEDGSLSRSQLARCDHAVFIPTKGSLNVAMSVNIILYDRTAKLGHPQASDDLLQRYRDNNNNLAFCR